MVLVEDVMINIRHSVMTIPVMPANRVTATYRPPSGFLIFSLAKLRYSSFSLSPMLESATEYGSEVPTLAFTHHSTLKRCAIVWMAVWSAIIQATILWKVRFLSSCLRILVEQHALEPLRKERRFRHTGSKISMQLKFRQAAGARARASADPRSFRV